MTDSGAGEDDSVTAGGGGTTGRSSTLRAGLAASGTAMAGLVVFGLCCVGCSTGGTGTRDEGPAGTQPVARVTPSNAVPTGTATPAERVDGVLLLRRDPKVNEQVKKDLKPCPGSEYPIDTSYGSLTDGPTPDVVVNLMTCGDSVGIGTYVYRQREGGAYENVFASEIPAVYGTIDRGDLVVTTQVYESKDAVAYPSGEEVVTYRWGDDRFTESDRVHNDFNRTVTNGEGDISEPAPPTPQN